MEKEAPRAERSMDMSQILSILNATGGQLDFRSVIHAVSHEIADLLPHDHLDVALVSPDGIMVTAWETGLHTEWDASTTARTRVDVSPIRDLFRGKDKFIITDDAQIDPRFHFQGAFSHAIFAANLHARLHAPLKVEGRVLGALSFSTQEIGTYRLSDVGHALIVADILSPYFFALQQGELARERELRQVEAEARAEGLRTGALQLTEELENARQALGMDLHDQTLADLSRIARVMKRIVERPSLKGSEIEPVQEDIEHCIRELRVIIDNARPSVLQFFGFGQAVEALLERSVGKSSTPMTYMLINESDGRLDELPPNTVVAIYRIVQEAINNAIRHANASSIKVILRDTEGGIDIVVEDDGLGLSLLPRRRTGGGLANMHTRASLIGAELRVTQTATGAGTRLELTVPRSFTAPRVPHEEPIG
jgi:signal transduction histidine kinase